jgi:hypothetical protein
LGSTAQVDIETNTQLEVGVVSEVENTFGWVVKAFNRDIREPAILEASLLDELDIGEGNLQVHQVSDDLGVFVLIVRIAFVIRIGFKVVAESLPVGVVLGGEVLVFMVVLVVVPIPR